MLKLHGIALRIPTTHDFYVISARKWALSARKYEHVYVHNES